MHIIKLLVQCLNFLIKALFLLEHEVFDDCTLFEMAFVCQLTVLVQTLGPG